MNPDSVSRNLLWQREDPPETGTDLARLESVRASARVAEAIVQELGHTQRVCQEQRHRSTAVERLLSVLESFHAIMSPKRKDQYLATILQLLGGASRQE
jgi:hypothetical protein